MNKQFNIYNNTYYKLAIGTKDNRRYTKPISHKLFNQLSKKSKDIFIKIDIIEKDDNNLNIIDYSFIKYSNLDKDITTQSFYDLLKLAKINNINVHKKNIYKNITLYIEKITKNIEKQIQFIQKG